MNDFLGNKTKEQIAIIKAIDILVKKKAVPFSAIDISLICGIPSKLLAGAFMSLANKNGEYPPLVLKAGRERKITAKGHSYVQLWRPNKDFDWVGLRMVIVEF